MKFTPVDDAPDATATFSLSKGLGNAAQASPPPAPEKTGLHIPGLAGMILGTVDAGASMASAAVAKPVSEVMGLAALTKDILSGNKAGDPEGFKNDVQDKMTYQPRTQVGQALTKYNPMAAIGRGVDAAGQGMQQLVAPPGSGPAQEAAGRGVHEAINQAPQFLGMKGPAMGAAAGDALKGGARGAMQSALKPSLADLRKGNGQAAVDTMLDNGVNVSPGGVDKLQGMVANLNQQIKDKIANSNAVVDKQAVGYRLQGVMDDFMKQVNPLDDVKAIQKAWDEFLDHPNLVGSNKIPVQQAQEMKQATYRALGDKSYGELKGADITAQKALARGLKEDIAAAVPEVQPLNAQESKLLNALPMVEKRVLMDANKNPFGLGWLTLNPAKFAGFMADRSPMFKSLVARMLNQGSKAAPTVGNLAPLGGAAVTQGANQMPAPPQQGSP